MKLFEDFEAVKFCEENLIFITHNRYLYYIYDPKYKHWWKHRNAENDSITVANYPDVSQSEIMNAMNGVLPKKETDFMRLCHPSQLCIRDMMDLLNEDYTHYMSDHAIYHTVHNLLLESDICYKSFLEIKKLLDNALKLIKDNNQVLDEIKNLCFEITGRDIFKKEIEIVDGIGRTALFWIGPVRVIDFSDTECRDNVAEMSSSAISIDESDVYDYLTPFLYKYFDKNLDANNKRIEYRWTDEDGNEQVSYLKGFEWYLTHNYFSFESIENIIRDINDTIKALSAGKENEFTSQLKKAKSSYIHDNVELVIDFYNRFIYRMEYMLRVGKEKGYDLISVMGP